MYLKPCCCASFHPQYHNLGGTASQQMLAVDSGGETESSVDIQLENTKNIRYFTPKLLLPLPHPSLSIPPHGLARVSTTLIRLACKLSFLSSSTVITLLCRGSYSVTSLDMFHFGNGPLRRCY